MAAILCCHTNRKMADVTFFLEHCYFLGDIEEDQRKAQLFYDTAMPKYISM